MKQALLSLLVLGALVGTAHAQPQRFYDLYQNGRAQLERSEFDAAVATLKEAVAAANGQVPDPNIFVALGYAEMRTGRLDEAYSSFTLARQQFGKLTPTSREQLEANTQVLRRLQGH